MSEIISKRRVLVKIGRSYYVAIPKEVVEKYGWYDYFLDVTATENEIIIRKIPGIKITRGGLRSLEGLRVNVGVEAKKEDGADDKGSTP
jgi:bifunctional DNA-binding transcriptional regulator/antitoxin component of YhaV-PrlF toxin-antitoxin module